MDFSFSISLLEESSWWCETPSMDCLKKSHQHMSALSSSVARISDPQKAEI